VFYMLPIPGDFRHWLLLIIFGNCLLTYLFEKVVVYYISIWDQNRLERKRLASIDKEISAARKDIELFFSNRALKEEAYEVTGQNLNSKVQGAFRTGGVPVQNENR